MSLEKFPTLPVPTDFEKTGVFSFETKHLKITANQPLIDSLVDKLFNKGFKSTGASFKIYPNFLFINFEDKNYNVLGASLRSLYVKNLDGDVMSDNEIIEQVDKLLTSYRY